MTTTEQAASKDVHAEAAKAIATAVKWSTAAAIVPLPYVDLIALGAVQVRMVRSLAKIYGHSPDAENVKGVVSALLGTLAPATVSAGLLGSSVKFVPLGGTLIGTAGLAAFGSAATYAIGKVFVRHFETGGSFLTFSAEAIEADLRKEFAAAKE